MKPSAMDCQQLQNLISDGLPTDHNRLLTCKIFHHTHNIDPTTTMSLVEMLMQLRWFQITL